MMQLSCKLNSADYENLITKDKKEIGEWTPTRSDWDTVFDNMAYNPVQVWEAMQPGKPRIRFLGWDGVAFTCPRVKGVPRFLVKLKGELSEARPEISILGMTAPNRMDIAAPLRSFPSFEVIISRRGWFEVQRTIHKKVYDNPEIDAGKLEYVESGDFPQLPVEVEARYERWRASEKQLTKTSEYRHRLNELVRQAEEMYDAVKPQKKITISMDDFSRLYRETGLKGDDHKIRELYQACIAVQK